MNGAAILVPRVNISIGQNDFCFRVRFDQLFRKRTGRPVADCLHTSNDSEPRLSCH